ncbi:MAG: glycosyltransferase family 4 protein [Acidimicrobiia bacterium]|nr:glycosyltransferase family 4 protein [Acidimicrobiia bacterium]
MTRIALVEQDGAGGMIHYAYQLADALTGAGADVTLHTGRRYELRGLPHRFQVRDEMNLWPAIESPRQRGLGAIGRKLRRTWRAMRYAVVWHRLTRRLIGERPDVVLFSTIRFPFQVVFLRRLRRHGLVLAQVCHEFEARERGRWSRAISRRLSLAVYRTFSVVFLHGEQNRKAFLGHFPIDADRTRVIHHGNESMFLRLADTGGDLRRRYGLGEDEPVALFFGGLRPSKGILDLIDAFAAMPAATPGRLLVVGQPAGIDPAEVRSRAEQAGIGGRVVVDGRYLPLEEVGPLMRTATVVVLPYRSATASGVLQVAFAFGRPVVATALGALVEDVEHGITGLLVHPDDPAELATAMASLLRNPDRARRMGTAAAEAAVTRFGWEPIAADILEALAEVKP